MVDMESRGFILAALGTDKCRDFAIIRGISDFADTQKGPKFQFIASVAAGATLGAMIETAYSTQQERAF
jgi:nucleoside phosphorylase